MASFGGLKQTSFLIVLTEEGKNHEDAALIPGDVKVLLCGRWGGSLEPVKDKPDTFHYFNGRFRVGLATFVRALGTLYTLDLIQVFSVDDGLTFEEVLQQKAARDRWSVPATVRADAETEELPAQGDSYGRWALQNAMKRKR